ncbi:phytanoyl-CoA dioxygenase [Roseibium denhamense]|uniref:Ectoine hydroxylase-related dioxygenase, phytanoyl-CoA dioxygenase (PhyH) family n=1 Tax=Roseibium denhamense TaxID=76305 RepID=A0ABY1PQZ0_9HYPH|nr:phytanoyl-CoA dioxygenase family protein [Roseibium denhamense]MTI05728.1 phytanoyl-CoA dioxygenase [Roseibium denhamense]SMP36953.1 Ectoine hydroxylase-related dioxygenase, phytanoyl-CoA dioxygenase (PhyH) family [Roseibium denhamense]
MDQQPALTGYFDDTSCDLGAFKALVSQQLEAGLVPHAARIEANIPIYDIGDLSDRLNGETTRRRLMAEWAHVFRSLSGVIVLKGAFENLAAIDAATGIYNQIIAEEKAQSGGGADHFAAAGANDRIWNSLEKLCLAAPDVFADYFANLALDAVCEAWLGPNYQTTAQINLVRPGGAAQKAHRDYHLGFQSAEDCARYPAHVHDLSPVMTLQGAVAHTDMPIVSGPTKLLPFSQLYRPGYAAYRLEPFRAFFEDNYVQVPLEKGDAVFFNPALFHAAGANTSADVQRMANLLQVSSAFGRTMETVDRDKMCRALYPVLLRKHEISALSEPLLEAAASCCAEGYSFPTNLDMDPPVGGLAPETQKQLMMRALREALPAEDFEALLDRQNARRRS